MIDRIFTVEDQCRIVLQVDLLLAYRRCVNAFHMGKRQKIDLHAEFLFQFVVGRTFRFGFGLGNKNGLYFHFFTKNASLGASKAFFIRPMRV